jgi:hypothetical protein
MGFISSVRFWLGFQLETVRTFKIEKVYICGMPSQLITYKELIAPISLAHSLRLGSFAFGSGRF